MVDEIKILCHFGGFSAKHFILKSGLSNWNGSDPDPLLSVAFFKNILCYNNNISTTLHFPTGSNLMWENRRYYILKLTRQIGLIKIEDENTKKYFLFPQIN